MNVSAKLSYARTSRKPAYRRSDPPQSVDEAVDTLKFSTRKAAHIVKKVLESAIANAEHNEGADIDGQSVSRAG